MLGMIDVSAPSMSSATEIVAKTLDPPKTWSELKRALLDLLMPANAIQEAATNLLSLRHTVATGTPLEIDIGRVATFVTLHLSGLPGSHHCIPRGIPISTPRLRLNFSRGSTITSSRVCGWGPLTRAPTCILVPPGSADTTLLRRKTQSSVPSSSHTASSAVVELSVSVWLGLGTPFPVADLKVVGLPVLAPSQFRPSP